ncbi:MAG: hypothetical protein GY944_29630, partial [bacterium]|nr:hypothetical protein [bacterium]
MAEVRVPLYRTAPGAGGVLCGAPVSASEWRSVAECYNWAAGRGRQLIAAFAPDHAALAKASTYWYALRVAPSYGALHRVWWITTRADTARGSADISLDSGTARGVSSNFFGTVPTEAPSPVLIERASVASQSTTHVTADLKFAPNEEAQFVDAISCWEIPRIKISSSVT